MYYPTPRPYRFGFSSPNSLARMMEDFLNPAWQSGPEPFEVGSRLIPTNVKEADDKYIVEAQILGAEPEDIEVYLENDVLTVSFQVEDTAESEEAGILQNEWKVESQRRSMRLPQVDPDSEPTAKLKNGILRVEVGKLAEKRRRKLSIS